MIVNKHEQVHGKIIFDFTAIMVPKLIDSTNYADQLTIPDPLDFRITIRMIRHALDTAEESTDFTATFVLCDPIWTGNGGANFIYAYASINAGGLDYFYDWTGTSFNTVVWYDFDTSGCS